VDKGASLGCLRLDKIVRRRVYAVCASLTAAPCPRGNVAACDFAHPTALQLSVALAFLVGTITCFVHAAQAEQTLRSYRVVGDAIPDSLTGTKGDVERGRSIVLNRQVGLCLLCHSGPYPGEKFQGTLAPDLKGTGSRWSEGELRLRIVDASRLYPDTIMPPYYRVDGLVRVAPAFSGKPILTAEQIEDVVAYLVTLRDESKP
jgi:L-cysteine S-thiosulfotransferase